MKLHEIFFSPTGGTKKVADLLASCWEDHASPIDLLKAPEALGGLALSEKDLCLIAIPSFGGRLPQTVVPSLRALKGNGALGILVAVFGNRAIDDTLMELRDIVTAAGIRCVAAVEAVAEHSLCRAYGAGRPDAKDREELLSFATAIQEKLQEGSTCEPPSLPGSHSYRSFGGVPFKPVASGRCIGCGRCAAECPAKAIPANAPRTTDGNLCISCMHCVSVCPVHARSLPAPVAVLAKAALAAKCSGHKPNKLYL